MKTLIKNGCIYLESGILESGSVIVDGNTIKTVIDDRQKVEINEGDFRVIDAKGIFVAPGYMDSHCHGGNGFDCNDGTEEAVVAMSKFYLTRGTR